MLEATTATIAFPSTSSKDVLTDILRDGAQRLLAVAITTEVDQWVESRKEHLDEQGRRQVVRNGYLPERKIQTGVGLVSVKQPRVHDRREEGQREKFSSTILPPYLRKTKSIEELSPWLYLKGISTGGFSEALSALLGPDSPGLSATTITRLVSGWQEEHRQWSKRSLEGKEYVYVWAIGADWRRGHFGDDGVASSPVAVRGGGGWELRFLAFELSGVGMSGIGTRASWQSLRAAL